MLRCILYKYVQCRRWCLLNICSDNRIEYIFLRLREIPSKVRVVHFPTIFCILYTKVLFPNFMKPTKWCYASLVIIVHFNFVPVHGILNFTTSFLEHAPAAVRFCQKWLPLIETEDSPRLHMIHMNIQYPERKICKRYCRKVILLLNS